MTHRAIVVLLLALCAAAPLLRAQVAPPAAPTPPTPRARMLPPPAVTNRGILLVNAAGLPAAAFEEIRAYAEKDLWVKVEGRALDAAWDALPAKMPGLFSSNRLVVVALANGPGQGPLMLAAPDNHWALANLAAFAADATPETVAFRNRQAAMRAIGLALGVPLCQDMHCVMRVMRKVKEPLKDMGSNFCGPSRRAYQTMAVQRGLFPVAPHRQAAPPVPAAPPAPVAPDGATPE